MTNLFLLNQVCLLITYMITKSNTNLSITDYQTINYQFDYQLINYEFIYQIIYWLIDYMSSKNMET